MASFNLFLSFSFLFFHLQPSRSYNGCHTGCGPKVSIRFPFQLMGSHPDDEKRCGYPGFTVACKNKTQNILSFPFTGEFKIQYIDYASQLIKISDPDECTTGRLLRQGFFNHSKTPFEPLVTQNFTFFNCTPDPGLMPISCLSAETYSIVAVLTDKSSDFYQLNKNCTEITTILYPSWSPDDYITLKWKEPNCQWCESSKGICEFKNDKSLDVRCLKPFDPDVTKSLKYAAIFVAALGLCITALIMCIHRGILLYGRSNPAGFSNLTNVPQGNVVVRKGLDSPAIETYPTTVVGESLELRKSADSVCTICLLEYQAKDILRAIPSCMHYFHADCIDKWLKRNATCPLCRN